MEHATILRTERVSVHSVTRHPENARRADTATLEASLREHGQYAPLIVHDQTGYIVKGNNTHRVMVDKLGATEIEATFISCSEAQARAILVVDNKATDGASYDETALLALLETLDADDMLAASGFSQADVDDLTALLEESVPNVEEMPWAEVTGDEPAAAPAVTASTATPDPKPVTSAAQDYDQRATRSLQVILPMAHYTWALASLDLLAEELELDTHADVLLRLIGDAADRDIPGVVDGQD